MNTNLKTLLKSKNQKINRCGIRCNHQTWIIKIRMKKIVMIKKQKANSSIKSRKHKNQRKSRTS